MDQRIDAIGGRVREAERSAKQSQETSEVCSDHIKKHTDEIQEIGDQFTVINASFRENDRRVSGLESDLQRL